MQTFGYVILCVELGAADEEEEEDDGDGDDVGSLLSMVCLSLQEREILLLAVVVTVHRNLMHHLALLKNVVCLMKKLVEGEG
jgi:hypothetical protein